MATKIKGTFLYDACIQSTGPLKATCSFRHQLDLAGKHSSHAAITREDYSFIFPPPSIARYSFIQLIALGRRGEKMPKLRNGSKGDSNTGSLDCESAILPRST